MRAITFFILFTIVLPVFSQPYKGKNGKTRHTFAQTVFGLEGQVSYGGNSAFINENGVAEKFNFSPLALPRIYIAGTHFWGHAEFYFALPLTGLANGHYKNVKYRISNTDIFGTKIFPWAIEKRKLRPYIGFSVSKISYYQFTNTANEKGLKHSKIKLPLLAGLNYCTGKYLVEAGVTYNYDNKLSYYISPAQKIAINTSPFFLNITLKKWLETTRGSEEDFMNGKTEKRYQLLKDQKKLNSWFFGLGPSSAFYTKSSPYNEQVHPYMQKPFSVNVFPEAVMGYYYQPFGLHFVSVFRTNSIKNTAYGTTQKLRRTSAALEVHKQLFDYHGFVPFVGICGSYEWLNFKQTKADTILDVKQNQIAPGVVFGWDILPDKLQGITLRTNLRYFPNLSLTAEGNKKVFFDQLEFNFIQLVIYPKRIKAIKKAIQEI